MLFFYLPLIILINFDSCFYLISLFQYIFLLRIIFSKRIIPKDRINKQNNKVGIVVPVYNEEETLEKFIKELYKFKSDIEVIFVNDCSTDSSLDIMNKYLDIYGYNILNRENKRGYIAGVLNDGVKYLGDNVDYIGVINSDSLFDGNQLDSIIEYINTKEVNIINMSNYGIKRDNIFYYIANIEKKFKNYIFYNIESCLNNGYFINRRLLNNLNNFSEGVLCEDLELSIRLGNIGETIYQVDFEIYDSYPEDFAILFRQKRRWIGGDILKRLKNIPKSVYELIVNIYYLMPIYFFINILFLFKFRNITYLFINNLIIEITLHILTGNNIIYSILIMFLQFLYMINFFIHYVLQIH